VADDIRLVSIETVIPHPRFPQPSRLSGPDTCAERNGIDGVRSLASWVHAAVGERSEVRIPQTGRRSRNTIPRPLSVPAMPKKAALCDVSRRPHAAGYWPSSPEHRGQRRRPHAKANTGRNSERSERNLQQRKRRHPVDSSAHLELNLISHQPPPVAFRPHTGAYIRTACRCLQRLRRRGGVLRAFLLPG